MTENRLNINFISEQTDDTGFNPLSLPNKAGIDFSQIEGAAIQHGQLDFEVAFNPGTYEYPILGEESLQVKISRDTKARIGVTLNKVMRDHHKHTIITDFRIDFSKPLILDNLMGTLTKFPMLFEDYDVQVFKHFFDTLGLPWVFSEANKAKDVLRKKIDDKFTRMLDSNSFLKDRFAQLKDRFNTSTSFIKSELAHYLKKLPRIRLDSITGSPQARKENWELEFAFTGEMAYPDRTIKPFDKVVLPYIIIPALHADVDRLFSTEPLASATIEKSSYDLDALMGEFAKTIGAFSGDFHLEGKIPPLRITGNIYDGGTFALDMESLDESAITGSFRGESSKERLICVADDLKLIVKDDVIATQFKMEVVSVGDEHHKFPVTTLVDNMIAGSWDSPDDELQLEFKILEGGRLSQSRFALEMQHPVVADHLKTSFALEGLDFSSNLRAVSDATTQTIFTENFELFFSADFQLTDDYLFQSPTSRLKCLELKGKGEGKIFWNQNQGGGVSLNLNNSFSLDLHSRVPHIPELGVSDAPLEAIVNGHSSMRLKLKSLLPKGAPVLLDLTDSRVNVLVDQLFGKLGQIGFKLPADSTFRFKVKEGWLDSTGEGIGVFETGWDLGGQSPQLSRGEQKVEIFVEELRKQSLEISVDKLGGVDIRGNRTGLYDAHFFNALLNPADEMQKWLEIFKDEKAVTYLIKSAELFNPFLAKLIGRSKALSDKIIHYFEEKGIEQPGDLLPGKRLGHFFSWLLVGTDEYQDEFHEIIKQVTDGKGFDVRRTRYLLDKSLPEHEYFVEIDQLLNWLKIVLDPGEKIQKNKEQKLPPYPLDEEHAQKLANVLSAGEIYEYCSQTEGNPGDLAEFEEKLEKIIPWLSLEQINWLLTRKFPFTTKIKAKLHYILEIKRRAVDISEHFGSIKYLFQQNAISFFLNDIFMEREPDTHYLVRGKPGPHETAKLLRSVLFSIFDTRTVQINLYQLLEYINRQDSDFLRYTLIESCDRSPRVLTGVLFALFELSQDLLKTKLDRVDLVQNKLNLEIPRRSDYMAGGKYARKSYFKALSAISEQILATADDYWALKYHIQNHYPDLSSKAVINKEDDYQNLEKEAIKAIAKADKLGAKCSFSPREKVRQKKARAAYEQAFSLCKELFRRNNNIIHLSWFKKFWSRNFEALTVYSVVDNYRQDIDQVRKWLHIRSGKSEFSTEQDLLEAVCKALYFYPRDQKHIFSDPLVRLLIEPPRANYNFSVVSCMGVVTDGKRGKELEAAYQRLESTRGVKVVRADTKTARTLEFNADKILEEIIKLNTPWGYIGYSQGCANALKAESILASGTPEQQKIIGGLRSRNLLFSAINGSGHGTCGDKKFLEAISKGDYYLKYYQGILSKSAVDFFLKNIALLLDSQFFIHLMGGIESLSHHGVVDLARSGVFKDGVPTTCLKGIVDTKTLPEALEFLSNVLTQQLGKSSHDTQVEISEAVGHFVKVANQYNQVLKNCEMESTAQATHHWSPLKKATEFLETEKDQKKAIYDTPKDRHVFPWIDVNGRFGVIDEK
ncbi:MAG: hypothetical protein PF689_01705 [Deltaproteobacteria bacterium]|jgi:hypothetical protein|nr:hypothetical protein [Deltaproteobacteria bacterium]